MNSALFATSRGIVMKYHISISKGLAITAAALFLWGCGKANSNAPAFGVSGHPANWLDKHRPAVLGKGTTASCQECHGADLLGGIAKTSCAECHTIPVFPFTPANHAHSHLGPSSNSFSAPRRRRQSEAESYQYRYQPGFFHVPELSWRRILKAVLPIPKQAALIATTSRERPPS